MSSKLVDLWDTLRTLFPIRDYFSWLGTTHFEATDARAAFPCFDEPQLKANFTLSMVRDQNYICLFNTELLSTADYGTDNHKVDHFATSVTMSTYLVAFVVCDFGQKSAMTKSGVKVIIYINLIHHEYDVHK